MKRILFPLFLVIIVCSFSLTYGEDLQSLRGGADIPAGSVPAVDIDMKSSWTPVPRTFNHQPPLVPHDISNFEIDPLTRDNDCLNCHGKVSKRPFITHYTDRDGNVGEEISQRWYFCTQCHVGQVDAPPLVENTYNK